MFDQCIFRLGQNDDERILIQIRQRRDHRETTDKFRDQAEFQQIFRLKFLKQFTGLAIILILHIRAEPDGGTFAALRDDPVEASESAAANEEDIRRIDLQEFLLRMLASALRRNGCNRAFHDFQKGLLHAFPAHIARDGRVVGFAADLVDFVDIDDAALRTLNIVVG